MIDPPKVRFSAAIVLAFLSASCASVPRSQVPNTPLTEQEYRAAARHCHSKHVIRMRLGERNVFYVGGLSDRNGRPSGEGDAKRIECVRQYLRIPSNDVLIVYS